MDSLWSQTSEVIVVGQSFEGIVFGDGLLKGQSLVARY